MDDPPPPPWGKAVGFPKAASTPPSQEKNLFLFLNTYGPIFPPLIEKDRGSTCVIVASFSLVNETPEKENQDPAGKSCRPQQAGEIPAARRRPAVALEREGHCLGWDSQADARVMPRGFHLRASSWKRTLATFKHCAAASPRAT